MLSALAHRLRGAGAAPAGSPNDGGWDAGARERLCHAFQADSFEAVQACAHFADVQGLAGSLLEEAANQQALSSAVECTARIPALQARWHDCVRAL